VDRSSWPAAPSIVDVIAAALKAKSSLFIRGAVTDAAVSGEVYAAIDSGETG
jgi:hypothetical protein